MVAAKQDILLQARVLYLFEVEENILSNGLNRVLFSRCVTAELREEHFAKSAFAQKCFFLKIF